MGCDQGSIVTRRGLTAVVALGLSMALCGCGGNANVYASAGNGSATSASISGASSVAALLSAIFLAGISYESDRDAARLAPYPGSLREPEPDPTRRVVEHDCTRPIEDWSANLRCR